MVTERVRKIREKKRKELESRPEAGGTLTREMREREGGLRGDFEVTPAKEKTTGETITELGVLPTPTQTQVQPTPTPTLTPQDITLPTPEEAAAAAAQLTSVNQDVQQFQGAPRFTDQPPAVQTFQSGLLAAATTGGLGAGAIGAESVAIPAFKVGGRVIANPQKAVQAGNAVKSSKAANKILGGFKTWGALALSALAFGGFSIKSFLDKTPEQQQGLNTLGQVTSTIVGDSTSAAGDFRLGLAELDNIEQRLLELESDIKAGGISSQTIKIDGRIININADIEDQLRTIAEGKRDIQSFVLEGTFPEMTPFELQTQLRQLEEDGLLEPVDLTKERRELSP